jgi:serine/threonine protein phosphatase PrpC
MSYENSRYFQVCIAQKQDPNGSIEQNACAVSVPFLNEASTCCFTLLEGHRSGLEVSRTAALHLHKFLEKEIQSNASGWNMKGCFENAYSSMDEALRPIAVDRGATAASCLIRKYDVQMYIHTANVGCTRAILCRGSKAICLTEDHSPLSIAEQHRLSECPSYTESSDRTHQLVRSTRALGDHLLKDWVISRPHYCSLELCPTDSAVICVTSSISLVLSDEEVAAIVRGKPRRQLCSAR